MNAFNTIDVKCTPRGAGGEVVLPESLSKRGRSSELALVKNYISNSKQIMKDR